MLKLSLKGEPMRDHSGEDKKDNSLKGEPMRDHSGEDKKDNC
jgi:hypothetical protein